MSCDPDIAARKAARPAGASPAASLDIPPHRVRFYGRRVEGAATPLVVHFHGGAFVAGSVDSPSLVAQLLADAGAVVLSVDYPLAPDHPFPSAVEAAYATLRWAHQHRQQLAGKGASLFVAGEEAGGCIAAAVALMARDRHGPSVDGQILFSPMLDANMSTASVRGALGTPAGSEWAGGWRHYLSCPCDASHPYATPIAGTRFTGLPPLLLLSGPDDPLRDEGRTYASRLRAAGVPVIRQALDRRCPWDRPGPANSASDPGARSNTGPTASSDASSDASSTARAADTPACDPAGLDALRARLFSFMITHPGNGARMPRP
jgi:acetyl esterase/lipase